MFSNVYVFRCSLVAAFGGFLFGFDTVVISGAEQSIQDLWGLGLTQHGLAISMALWGTVLGALLGAYPSDALGRQKTLLWIGVLYFVSAVGSAYAPEVYSFMGARFIGGIAVGISTIAAPLYISEIAPAEYRGRLTGMFQFNIVFGILIAFLSNSIIGGLGENAWRWMLGVEAFPALAYTLLCFGIPESPRWLIAIRNDRGQAEHILQRIHPNKSAQEIEKKAEVIANVSQEKSTSGKFWSSGLKRPITLAFFIAFFNQLSGINAVLYFSPRIFELTGLEEKAALLQSVGIGVTNLIFTFLGLWLIDRLGRRTLLIIGSYGYILSLGLCAWAFFTENFAIVPVCIFAFIAAHAVGQGAVIWVFISEIFPARHRGVGQSLGSFTHWVFAALITLFFPRMVSVFAPGYIFLFFCIMMIFQLVWVKLKVPETKGVSLEKMQERLNIYD